METTTENPFDPERFRADLATKTKDFAENRFITYGRGDTTEGNERKQVRADVLYSELLDDCTEALLAADDKEATMEIIKATLVRYRKGGHQSLFAIVGETEFYHDLAIRLAKKASEHLKS